MLIRLMYYSDLLPNAETVCVQLPKFCILLHLTLHCKCCFSNHAANTITRAVLKTGGCDSSSRSDFNMEGLDDEKLKGIEPKMVELIMNEVYM